MFIGAAPPPSANVRWQCYVRSEVSVVSSMMVDDYKEPVVYNFRFFGSIWVTLSNHRTSRQKKHELRARRASNECFFWRRVR